MALVQKAFREHFRTIRAETLQWYPGHMDKSFNKMQSKIKQVDCVLEVHDARIPLTGRNPNFINKLIGPKPHILVLNKMDLIDGKTLSTTVKKLSNDVQNIIFTNAKDQQCRGLKKIVTKSIDLIHNSDRFNRAEERNLRLMVIGVPNVGKSSVINGLRNRNLHKGKAAAVGAIAGVTRAVQSDIKVNANPPLYLVDTPGILPPKVKDDITGLKLALCSCFNDNVVGHILIADFLLYFCNKFGKFAYVDFFELGEPNDDIGVVLSAIAKKQNKFIRTVSVEDNKEKILPDTRLAAQMMISAFRSGQLGHFSLDFTELDQ